MNRIKVPALQELISEWRGNHTQNQQNNIRPPGLGSDLCDGGQGTRQRSAEGVSDLGPREGSCLSVSLDEGP